ncbi:MAG TPA: N-acetyltransferase [bacterium]|nr:N-acetyltransferase [bacterium]
MEEVFIHPKSDVHSPNIGDGTRIWQYVVVLPQAAIGRDCNICSHCFIEGDVVVGDRVTVKWGCYLPDGLVVGNKVFIGPGVTFTNDRFPRSKEYPDQFSKTIIEDGASIGAGVVIIGGISIGKNSMIGAGSVVNKSVPPNELWVGNPAVLIMEASKFSLYEKMTR